MIDYQNIITHYKSYFWEDSIPQHIIIQLNNNENMIDRKNMNGHFTASSFVFSTDFKKLLCIYHSHRQVRQQPGWHIDDTTDHPFVHWLRELYEETGLQIIRIHDWHINNNLCPLNIDIQEVEARLEKNESHHQHYDIQFVCIAEEQILHSHDDGVQDIERKDITELSNEMQERVKLLKQRLWVPQP